MPLTFAGSGVGVLLDASVDPIVGAIDAVVEDAHVLQPRGSDSRQVRAQVDLRAASSALTPASRKVGLLPKSEAGPEMVDLVLALERLPVPWQHPVEIEVPQRSSGAPLGHVGIAEVDGPASSRSPVATTRSFGR